MQDVNFFRSDDIRRRGAGGFSGEALEIEDMACGYGVEDEALSQIIGMIQSAVLDSGAGFHGFEEQFDGPSTNVPANDVFRGLGSVRNGPAGRAFTFGEAFGGQ